MRSSVSIKNVVRQVTYTLKDEDRRCIIWFMTDSSRKKLGKNIQKERREKGLTQAQLALKVGISVNHLSKIERGNVNPTVDSVELITKALGVHSSAILPY